MFNLVPESYVNERQRIPKGQSKMDNPEKPATQGTQGEDKQYNNKTLYVLDTTVRKQTHITKIRHEPSFKPQLFNV